MLIAGLGDPDLLTYVFFGGGGKYLHTSCNLLQLKHAGRCSSHYYHVRIGMVMLIVKSNTDFDLSPLALLATFA